MKASEKGYLVIKKKQEGKDDPEIYEEIEYLNNSQEDFKVLNKKIRDQQKYIDRLESKLEKATNTSKDFKKQFKIDINRAEQKEKEIMTTSNGTATIKDLNRMLSLIEEEGSVGLADLSKTCILKAKVCKGALNFLERIGLIKLEKKDKVLMVTRI